MAIARRGTGIRPAASALASQIHPVFMLPPLAASLFGGIVASLASLPDAGVHTLAMFFAVYTAHVKDGYVDFYRRGEDDYHPMTPRGCQIALAGAAVGFLACLVYLAIVVDPLAALLTLPTWLVGYFHAPQLDTNPVTTTAGYPTGIALAILGGYYVQAATLTPEALAYAAVFLPLLCGVIIIDDAQDYAYDRSIGKRTVVVALGPNRGIELAYGLLLFGLICTLWFTLSGLFPPSAALAVPVLLGIIVPTVYADAEVSTMLLIRGSYLFFAVLIVASVYQPLATVPLPDLGFLGPYTYLASEILFGSAAAVVLYRTGALRRAARTIIALYPIAYVWDWYSLEIGIFAIELRTGIDLFGIPLEEHLFMIVVPAVVLAIDELVHRGTPVESLGDVKVGDADAVSFENVERRG